MASRDITEIVAAAAAAGFAGDALVDAIAVALAESGGDPTATNTEGNNAGVDRGAWQINDYWHSEVSDEEAFDPYAAARHAYRITKGGKDWSQWTTYRHGKHNAYRGQALEAVRQYRPGEKVSAGAEQAAQAGTFARTAPQDLNDLAAAQIKAFSDIIAGRDPSGMQLGKSFIPQQALDVYAKAEEDEEAADMGVSAPPNARTTGGVEVGRTSRGTPRGVEYGDAPQDTDTTMHADNAKAAWGSGQNGRHAKSELAAIPSAKGHKARPDVAAAMEQMIQAAKRDGITIKMTDSYRTYDQQVALRNSAKARNVSTATPGTSIHGWGAAFDLNIKDTKVLNWLRANAGRFGFVNPPWAQKAGKSYEPWHWEYWRPYAKGTAPGAGEEAAARRAAQEPGHAAPREPNPRPQAPPTAPSVGAAAAASRPASTRSQRRNRNVPE